MHTLTEAEKNQRESKRVLVLKAERCNDKREERKQGYIKRREYREKEHENDRCLEERVRR